MGSLRYCRFDRSRVAKAEARLRQKTNFTLRHYPRKLAFASELDNFILADPQLNRYVKNDRDTANWLPEHNRCWFVRTDIHVKRKYELTVDPSERDPLAWVLSECKEESNE